MKFSPKYYFEVTPTKLSMIGKLLTSIGGVSGISTIVSGHPILGATLFCAGHALDILSNFFTENTHK